MFRVTSVERERAAESGTVAGTMSALVRRITVGLAVLAAAVPAGASASAPMMGGLSGTWSGSIGGASSSSVKPLHIVITINAAQTGGSWEISPSCRGPLTLQSISNGYHHYLRHLAHGSTCAGGDVDCVMRSGANVYDSVTSHLGGAYDVSGTLRPVRMKKR